jgi:hypothetical protein
MVFAADGEVNAPKLFLSGPPDFFPSAAQMRMSPDWDRSI